MDPITILAAVGTTLKIVKELCEGLRWMQRAWESVANGDKTLRLIALECNIYGESIKTIGQWLKANQGAIGLKRQMRTTHNAITLVQVSLANLLLDLKKVQESGDKTILKDKKISQEKQMLKMFQQVIIIGAKKQWFREIMTIHLAELRANASTLHLTLGVIELTERNPEKTSIKTQNKTEKLEDKTGQLEKKLLLRQLIAKALEFRRQEELTKRDESEELSSKSTIIPSPGLIHSSPQKLTLYDVVQLARQQALAEKTRKSSEDLIDLSDSPQPLQNQGSSSTAQDLHDLLDFTFSMAPQKTDPLPQNEPGTSELNHDVKSTSDQTASLDLITIVSQEPDLITLAYQEPDLVSIVSQEPELVITVSQEPSGVNPLEYLEPRASQTDDLPKKETSGSLNLTTTSNHTDFPLNQSSVAQTGQESDNKETSIMLEQVDPDASQADDSNKLETAEPLASTTISNNPDASLGQSSAALVDEENDIKRTLATFEPVEPKVSGSAIQGIHEVSASSISLDHLSLQIDQSSAALIDQGSDTTETPIRISPISTTVPSIFSHSSSLSSETGFYTTGVTEEDVQARSLKFTSFMPKSSPSLVRGKEPDCARPSISKSLFKGNDAELGGIQSCGSTSTIHVDSELPPKLQRAQTEESVSQSPPLPILSNIDEPDEQGFPWIVQAAHDGNEEMIKKLLVSGADIKASHATTRQYALSEASIQGHHKIVDLLIEEGCPLDYPDAEGYTALHHACKRGNLIIAKSLIINGALIDALGPKGQTALHIAIQVPNQNIVMLLIQHKANVNARDDLFRTPLHLCASQGNVAMCSYLLNEGAQLDSREAQSKTPLQIACEAGHHDLVRMMLDQSSLNPTNMTFLAAFFAAVEYGHVQIAESFFPRGLKLQELQKDSYKPATLAAKSGSLDMIDLVIKENCDVNTRDENGWSALHFASYHGHYQIIDRLIGNGISTTAVTSQKETPLLLAIKEGHFAVTERLLRKDGSLVRAEDEKGQQPVHYTAHTGSVEIFNLLMSSGAKINMENSFGWQPIHIAIAYGHLVLVQRLLEQGANVEEKLGSTSIKKDQTHRMVEDGYWAEARWPYPGSRPLHLACEYGHYQIATYLISKGAKIESTCSEGWQPLHHATYIGFSALVEVLLGSGVNPHATTNEGKTAQGLQFCTSGAPILEEEKERIRQLLRDAMERTRKQKSFKVALKKSSTVDEKNILVRAATCSMDLVSRPHTHRTMSTTPTLDPFLARPQSASRSTRPIAHLSHTLPLPLISSDSAPSSHQTPTPPLPEVQLEIKSLDPSVPSNSELKNTEKIGSETSTANSATDRLLSLSNANTPISAPTTEMQVSIQPEPKLKRRSTFGLSKVKPGIDLGRLGLGNIGKQTFEIGKQTLDIKKQTFELGKQGIVMGKQGIEMGKQGLEKGKQGLDIGKQVGKQGLEKGKQGLDIGKQVGKQGYKKAKKFATKGKWKSGKSGTEKRTDKHKSDGNQDNASTGGDKLNSVAENADDHHGNEEGNDDDDDGESLLDDAASTFSLGEFAEFGSSDF